MKALPGGNNHRRRQRHSSGHRIAIAFRGHRGWRVQVEPSHVDARHLDLWTSRQGEALAYANRLSRLRGWPIIEEDHR